MRRKSFLAVAVLIASIYASSPLLVAGHAHDSSHDGAHCALCSLASSGFALGSGPPGLPPAPAGNDEIHRGSQPFPAPQARAANRSRAPPSRLS